MTIGLYGRFGNQVLEAAMGLYLSRLLEVPRLIVQQEGVFTPGEYSIGGTSVSVLPGRLERPTPLQAFFLGTDFPGQIHLHGAYLLNWMDSPYSIDYENFGEGTRSFVESALRFSLDNEPLPDDYLTLSLRGGDVFQNPVPSHYGQPPLAHYQLAVLSRTWKEVVVVYEDETNPIFSPLKTWLRKNKIRHSFLQQDWIADMQTIYRSRFVCAPAGSFVHAIAAFSPHIRKVWVLEGHKLPINPKQLILVTDVEGSFRSAILQNNWVNSVEQRELMIDYPIELLTASQTE